ncbi:glycosyltransferase family 2 protein [Flavobacteriaceae bacterium]|nr:glycosyltransferase family 2 protein [Flavobacteriaceae bacterium]
MKLVSVIMATFNREKFILESINAIKNQTYQNYECIIIDDGSSGKTFELIKSYVQTDIRFKVLRRTSNYQKGLSGCRNMGLDICSGDFIVFFDDDDIPHSRNLEICLEELKNINIDFCRYGREVFHGDFHYNYDTKSSYDRLFFGSELIEPILKNEFPLNSCAVIWKKECFTSFRFNENLHYAEEWELYSKLIMSGKKGLSIDKTLFYGRKHEDSNTGEFYAKKKIRMRSNALAILETWKNLERYNLKNERLFRHFVQLSLDYKEFNLFSRLCEESSWSKLSKVNWKIFYFLLPCQLRLYKLKKLMLN